MDIYDTINQVNELRKQLKASPDHQNKSDDQIDELILNGFIEMFMNKEITIVELQCWAAIVGYEFTPEFEEQLADE